VSANRPFVVGFGEQSTEQPEHCLAVEKMPTCVPMRAVHRVKPDCILERLHVMQDYGRRQRRREVDPSRPPLGRRPSAGRRRYRPRRLRRLYGRRQRPDAGRGGAFPRGSRPRHRLHPRVGLRPHRAARSWWEAASAPCQTTSARNSNFSMSAGHREQRRYHVDAVQIARWPEAASPGRLSPSDCGARLSR
jgi:hypothetical protein